MATKIDVLADFYSNGIIVPISFKYNGNLFSIEEIKTHFVNDYYVYEVICREDSYTIIFNGKYWYIDGNNWIDYMGLRKKSL